MSDKFYRAFEDKFRGSRTLIQSRLAVYLPFVSPWATISPNARGLDLGCGRGEWLELLEKEGIQPLGIDMDGGMLEVCHALKLPAIEGDAIAHLTGLEDESHSIITAFHFVEHIPFPQLQLVIAEALRVLKPGGILIMETPNPENIEVGTKNFYLDPTHQRPIPHHLLAFLPEHCGFLRTKVLRLQEPPTLLQQNTLGLHDVFTGSSPDYAVIAQKAAKLSILEQFDSAFSKEYGLSLATLSRHYDERIQSRLTEQLKSVEIEFETKLQEQFHQVNLSHRALEKRLETQFQEKLQEQAHQANLTQRAIRKDLHALEAKLETHIHQQFHQLGLEAQGLHQQLRALRQANEHTVEIQQVSLNEKLRHAEQRAQEAEIRLTAATAALKAMHSSTYWRLSAPLRWLTIQLKLVLTQGPFARAKALTQKIFGKDPALPLDSNLAQDIHPVAGATTTQNEPAKHQMRFHSADALEPGNTTAPEPTAAGQQEPAQTIRAAQTEPKPPLIGEPTVPAPPTVAPEPKVSARVEEVYKKLKDATNQTKELS